MNCYNFSQFAKNEFFLKLIQFCYYCVKNTIYLEKKCNDSLYLIFSRSGVCHMTDFTQPLKNAAKRDSAGAVCNSGMGMLFFNVFYFGRYVKYNFLEGGG